MEFSHNTATRQLSQMFCAIFFFHISEFLLAIATHGKRNVTRQSLLINKSHIIDLLFSLLEYMVEYAFFPGLKEHWWLSHLGLALVVTGEIFQKVSILTAGRAFTHIIRTRREDCHKLVSYISYLIWSVGTQVMLINPISTVAFSVVVWRFFAERIAYEESYLRQIFGTDYVEYAQRVPSGIPFVK